MNELIELIKINKYRWWKLQQPRPPEIDPKDRLTIVPDELGKEDEDERV